MLKIKWNLEQKEYRCHIKSVGGTKCVLMEQKEYHLGTFGVSVPYHPAGIVGPVGQTIDWSKIGQNNQIFIIIIFPCIVPYLHVISQVLTIFRTSDNLEIFELLLDIIWTIFWLITLSNSQLCGNQYPISIFRQ